MAVVLAVSGGFRTTVGGFRISARSPLAASVAALIAGAAWWFLARRERLAAADLEALWLGIERHSSRLIGAIALVAAIVAASFATRSAAGADASGYLSQAAMWARGETVDYQPFDEPFQFPTHNGWLMTPLGWIPFEPNYLNPLQVPTYPPGLPLLMAVPHALAGLDGATAVVIASAALAVWSTGMIAGGTAGVMAAILLAFVPPFLYQSFQPMSDVPVTAAWMMCFLLAGHERRSLWAGIACAAAVLIRPNLGPLAVVPWLLASHKWWFAAPVAAAGLFLGYMQLMWYGSPLRSGYGAAEELFAFSNVGPNATRYFTWLIATAPVLLFAPLGFMRTRSDRRSVAAVGFAVLVIAAYLIYAVFDHWSYLRFLLPALALFAVFAAIELTAWIQRWPMAWRAPLFLALVLTVVAYSLIIARSLDAFKLRDQLRRVEQVAEFINRTAPDYAVMLAGEQSGSMRYYTDRSILRWEAAAPDELATALASLAASDRPVYIVLDAWENEPFLRKFAAVTSVALDWPAAVDAGTTHRTHLWRAGDRARFLAGENLQTVRLP